MPAAVVSLSDSSAGLICPPAAIDGIGDTSRMDGTPRTRARRRTRPSAPAEPEAAPAPAAAAIADEVELLEDHTRPITHHRTRRRLGVSVPGAVLGAFLITAMAFGASLR